MSQSMRQTNRNAMGGGVNRHAPIPVLPSYAIQPVPQYFVQQPPPGMLPNSTPHMWQQQPAQQIFHAPPYHVQQQPQFVPHRIPHPSPHGQPAMMQPVPMLSPVSLPLNQPSSKPPVERAKKIIKIENPVTKEVINEEHMERHGSAPKPDSRASFLKSPAEELSKSLDETLKILDDDETLTVEEDMTQQAVEESPTEGTRKEDEKSTVVERSSDIQHEETSEDSQTCAVAPTSLPELVPYPCESLEDVSEESRTEEADESDVEKKSEGEENEEEKRESEEDRRREYESGLEKMLSMYTESFDEDACSYGRDFLYALRDLEMEFKATPCPLSIEQIKDLGLTPGAKTAHHQESRSFTRPSFEHRPHSHGAPSGFQPSWQQQKGGGGHRAPYVGRSSVDALRRNGSERRPMKKIPPVSRPSIERPTLNTAKLHKAENAWRPDKATKDPEDEEAKRRALLKSVRALFNKITPSNREALSAEFLSYNVSSDVRQLEEVVNVIFDKAVEEPKFCPLYSEICTFQVDNELKDPKRKGVSPFRNQLLVRAQDTFNAGGVVEEARQAKLKQIAEESDAKKKLIIEQELKELDARMRRRKYGNITLIGQLFHRELLSAKVVHWCLMHLLKGEEGDGVAETDERISCAVQMIESIGPRLENVLTTLKKENEAKPEKERATVVSMEAFYAHLDSLKPKVSPRVRFSIMNLMDLRRSGWVPRKTTDQGPKKIEEIHQQAKQEAIENQLRENARPMSTPKTILMRDSQGKNTPAEPQKLTAEQKEQRARKAAQQSAMTPNTAPPKTQNLSQVDSTRSLGSNRKSAWAQGSSGGSDGPHSSKSSSSTTSAKK